MEKPIGTTATSERSSYRIFIVSVSLAVALCLGGVFLGMTLQHRSLINRTLLERARTDFANIVTMRAWNASYGGVYVEKRPGVVANPYLKNPDITTVDGRVFTKKNPALMTREISSLLEGSSGYAIHITSLNPLAPGNHPDAAEEDALRAFESGARERFWFEDEDNRRFFRYMAPLHVDATCLECHAEQDYRIGDVRGGISLRFDVQEVENLMQAYLWRVSLLALATIATLTGIIYYFFSRLTNQLSALREQLKAQAITDPLTGLFNRRYLMERFEYELVRGNRSGESMGCIMLDIDHFKNVNDLCGHLVGDAVLKTLARCLREAVRPYDIVGRYGGEEFLVIAPHTTPAELAAIAERLRTDIALLPLPADMVLKGLTLTVSAGITGQRPGDTADRIIHRADTALYRAKEAGRNRVEALP